MHNMTDLDILNPIFFVFILAVGIASSLIFQKVFNEKQDHVKYLSIDGLRGYLAFFVFIGHSAIWYYYLKTGTWTFVNSKLFYASAAVSVLFFFMITAFLFFLKLIDNKTKPIDWTRLYVSRLTRLLPLYYFVFFIILLFVFILTDFKLNESPIKILKEIIQWLSFNLLGITNINGSKDTTIIIAQVVWSLQYEWLFYFTLPLVNLIFFRSKINVLVFLINTILLVSFTMFLRPEIYYFYIFLGGVIAAFVVKKLKISNPNSLLCNVIMILSIAIFFVFFKINTHQYFLAILLFFIFSLIALGNSIFGILTTNFSRFLGKISYSIYLIHPIVLFVAFRFVLSYKVAKQYSAIEFWGLIAILTPVLILISYFTFKIIEEPIMKKTSKITSLLKRNKNV